MNKPVYLRQSILKIDKIVMSDYCYHYVKRKYGTKRKLFYMDTDSFIVYIKTKDIYDDIAKHVETRFDTLNN